MLYVGLGSVGLSRRTNADATVASILSAPYLAAMRPEAKAITVRDLLTMTSGRRWDEDTTETQIQQTPDWVAAILKLPAAARPGTTFNYSSGDTHLSSAVLTSATQRTSDCDQAGFRMIRPSIGHHSTGQHP